MELEKDFKQRLQRLAEICQIGEHLPRMYRGTALLTRMLRQRFPYTTISTMVRHASISRKGLFDIFTDIT